MLLQVRLKTLLDTCTYVVFNYTRRGLFDRDKLIVLTLLTFHIMLKVLVSLLASSKSLHDLIEHRSLPPATAA